MNLGTALRGALVMIVVGSALGLAHNALSPEPVPWKPVPRTALSLDDLLSGEPNAPDGDASGEPFSGSLEGERAAAEPIPPAGDDPGPAVDDEAASAEHPDHPGAFETLAAGGEVEPETPSDAGNGDEPAAAAPDGNGAETSPASTAGRADYSDIPESEFPIEVSLARAKSLYDRGGLRVLDARELHEFATGHIREAENAPFDEMVGDVEWLERVASDPRPLLVYCDGTDCELSLNLGFEISQSGHRKVLVLESGYSAWAEAGFPTATGEHP